MKQINKIMAAVVTVMMLATTAGSNTAQAQGTVKLSISDGIYDEAVKGVIEKNASELITEINRAGSGGSDLALGSIDMAEEARTGLTSLWQNIRLTCDEAEVVERCLTTKHGYQVRNLPFMMTSVTESDKDPEYQEAVINFDKKGKIESFYLTISMNMYKQAMSNKHEITDVRRRMEILDYVEHFRTAYNQKDLNFMQQIFSDDALIITGHVIKTKPTEVMPADTKVVYRKQSKKEYLANLSNAFRSNSYIKVNFDDVKISAHPTNKDVYGVTVHQTWNSSRYSDEGYVFMIWDFSNEDAPQIHVRTWQPEYLDKEAGKRLNPNDIFTLSDFVL